MDMIKRWFRGAEKSVEERTDGETPVATPPPGAVSDDLGDTERETSTNAQTAGAADEPWPGN
jgi:hypothetical protein